MPADLAAHIEAVARHLLGEPNRALSSRTHWRFASNGSLAVELDKGTWFDFERNEGGGVLDLIYRETGLADGAAVEWLKSELGIRLDDSQETTERRIVATYDYRDEAGALLFQVVRFEPKDFRQRRPDGNGGWTWSVKGVRHVPYHAGLVRVCQRVWDIASKNGPEPFLSNCHVEMFLSQDCPDAKEALLQFLAAFDS